jgi:PST family polysaccharide transporter/antigen flippase
MSPFRSAFLISLAHLAKLITGIAFIKIISTYLGPEGVGKLGYLISFMMILYVFSGGEIQNIIVKFVKKYKQKPKKLYFLIEKVQYYFIETLIILSFLIVLRTYAL